VSRRVLALIVALASLPLWASPAQATFTGKNGKFVYHPISPVDDGIWTSNPDGSEPFHVTTVADDAHPAWSPNGQRIAFTRFLTNPNQDDIFVVNADGTNPTNVTQTSNISEDEGSWSPDGTKLVLSNAFKVDVVNVDGTGRHTIATAPAGDFYRDPKWSPDGGKIAFMCGPGNNEDEICTVNPDGTGLANITNTPTFTEYQFDWSPDGTRITFEAYPKDGTASSDVFVMNRDGTGRVNLTPNTPSQGDGAPFWAPNGGQILFRSSSQPSWPLYVIAPSGGSPIWFAWSPANGPVSDWQAALVAAPAGIVRPKGASPLRVSLVPAFGKCNAPDATHGAPLAYPSCLVPRKLSQYLTMGTPDANGRGPKATDSVTLTAIPGDPATSASEADVELDATITDVRGDSAAGTYPDYLGELRVLMSLRLTQRVEIQTTSDFPFDWTVPCAGTADTNVGSTCSITTSANSLLPGAVIERYRTIWQVGQVQVQDGGEDGEGATEGDNTLYLKQGVFVP
jgi:hypothetical protein